MKRTLIGACAALALFACDDKKKDQAPPGPSTPPAASASAVASAGASADPSGKDAPPAGAIRYEIAAGKASFLIDAPLEKIKGMTDEARGHLDVNPKELGKSRGEVMIRLSTLKTSTFDDVEKNAAQTEHARNWMEVGPDSPEAARMKYEWATLAITSVEATPSSVAEAKDEGGARKVKAKIGGDLTIHGVTSKKSVSVTLTFKGPPEEPTEIMVKTDQPMPVSMKEHGIMPRDTVGGLLNGALERIGKKIDDKVQVSFEAQTTSHMPSHP